MNLIISILLSLLLGGIAYLKKALTIPALILAVIFSIIISYYGGLTSFIILVTVFLGSIITKIFQKEKKKQSRNIIQIICNVGIPTISIIIYGLTKNDIYLLIYASVMSESLADTLASDIGKLSKKDPVNILTWKKSKKGLSGNISMLGLFSALIGTILIGIIYYVGMEQSLLSFMIIVLSGFLGSVIDSILGATFQVKYRCPKCKEIVEQKNHCETFATYYKGIKVINNNTVNFLTNLIVFLILVLALIILGTFK